MTVSNMLEDKSQSLGEVLKGLMDNVISPKRKQSEQFAQAWSHLLPEELAGHCEIVEFSSGILKVKTDGPGYQHELRLCKKMLMYELNRTLKSARVRDIRFAV